MACDATAPGAITSQRVPAASAVCRSASASGRSSVATSSTRGRLGPVPAGSATHTGRW
jgi:hypothetical protein